MCRTPINPSCLKVAFLVAGIAGGLAWAETVELVSYFPAPASGGADLHVQSLTVGSAYQTQTPPNGTALVANQLAIGTTTPLPLCLLTLAGDWNAGFPQLTLQGTSNPNRRLYVGYDTTNNLASLQAAEETVGPTPLLLQRLGGNVGIGVTSNPATRLEIAQNTALKLGNAYLSSGGAALAYFTSNAWFNGTTWQIPDATRTSARLQLSDNTLSFDNTTTAGSSTWNSRVTLNSNGRVGIGTTTPQALLDVAGSGEAILLPRSSGAPASPVNGMIYYDTALQKFQVYEGGSWKSFGTGPGIWQTGSYTGTGGNVSIPLNFRPRAVLIFKMQPSNEAGYFIVNTQTMPPTGSTYTALNDKTWDLEPPSAGFTTTTDISFPSPTGFQAKGSASISGKTYYYLVVQ